MYGSCTARGGLGGALLAAGMAALLGFAPAAQAAPVDLSGWTANGGGNWVLQNAPANDGVLQTVNTSTPAVFFGPGNAQGLALSGQISVQTNSDDDFIGFVLGYNDGDLTNPLADYILIDWKQATQAFSGGVGLVGLAISRVTGALSFNDGWRHEGNVEELQRAATLGSTGWTNFGIYEFDIAFTATNIVVWVNGVEELNITGTFSDGSFGFYNLSQANVLYSAVDEDVAPPLPEPGTLVLFGLGLAALGLAGRRRRAA